MSNRDRLDSYLKQVEKRLRLDTLLRGALLLTSTALAATLILVFVTNGLAFSPGSIMVARAVLFLLLAAALGLGLVRPLYGISRRRAAASTETAFPRFQQRLVTFVGSDAQKPDPFMELLAADTLELARDAKPESLAPRGRLMLSLSGCLACLGVLIWMIAAGPGYLGYGAARLWRTSSRDTAAFYDIRVSPGDAAVRRKASQTVTAQLIGFGSPHARLYARYKSASKWESAEMQPQPDSSAFQFVFAGLPEAVEYYIEAGRVRSRYYNLRVVDLPRVKRIRVTYHYPSWTGSRDRVEEHESDLRAVTGTAAELTVLTDRPLRGGVLALKNGRQTTLSGGQENLYKGMIQIQNNGSYHVAALDRGQLVRLSDEFFIEARKANPPEVSIMRPQEDYRASPIEEVKVAVQASDDFALREMSLHYSVNGGPERAVNILNKKGAKDAEGSTILYLENFKVVPGDVVSYYAQARDGRSEARSAMSFVEVQPFDREYSQSQLARGGGMSGQQQSEISRREKEIIAATWKQQSGNKAARQQAADMGNFLASAQDKLRNQALSLAGRLQARGLSEWSDEFSAFQRDMNAAANAMKPASEKLGQEKWKDALPSEEKALQQLLRAEATFRRIEVAFGSQGGGGGAGAGRDLSDLQNLELDTQKNQYETGQNSESASQRASQLDKTLQKLDELAQREQRLADLRSNGSLQSYQQRWQQEMLHREAEQLQKQLEQLAQSMARGQQGSSQASKSSSSTSANEASGGASQDMANGHLQRALDRLREANSAMRRTNSQGANAADARRAADALTEARRLLNGIGRQQASGQLNSLARETDRLASEEHNQAALLRKMFGTQQQSAHQWPRFDGGSQQEAKLADDRQLLATDLSRLKKELQGAARQLQSTQPSAASKLYQALGETERADLENRLSRSAESIRRGIDPNSKALEPAITSAIDRMNAQVHEAQQALKALPPNPAEEQLARVERLRRQIEALTRNSGSANNGQPGEQPRGDQATQEAQNGEASQAEHQNNEFQSGGQGEPRAWRSGRNAGPGRFIERPGTEGEGSTRSSASGELALREAMRQLQNLRRELRGAPASAADIDKLMRDLSRLGTHSYGATPAVIQQLGAQALASVDRIELQLRRQLNHPQTGQVRNGDTLQVPPGYQDSVAAYFRRLSQSH